MGNRADAIRARDRPGPSRVPRAIPLRPDDRRRRTLGPWPPRQRPPDPFEALTWTICEQLIESERAATIQRRLSRALGRSCPRTGLRDSPSASAIAGRAPALLQSMDLSAGRAIALVKAAREVTSGRVDLLDPDHERGWRRLRAIRGIGSWTVQKLALTGQGRLDQLPAGDLAYSEARGPATDRRSARTRDRGGGRRVLRALCAMGRTRRESTRCTRAGLPAGPLRSRREGRLADASRLVRVRVAARTRSPPKVHGRALRRVRRRFRSDRSSDGPHSAR